MLKELPEEMKNDPVDKELKVDHWLHKVIKEDQEQDKEKTEKK